MLLLYLASSLYMVGLIWFVQIVHYPLFEAVKDASGEYYRMHAAKTGLVVALPMLVQMGCAIFFALKPGAGNAWMMRGLLVVLAAVWLTTFLLSVPQHTILANGYDAHAVRRLVNTNWIRTVLWSAHAAGLLWIWAERMKDKL